MKAAFKQAYGEQNKLVPNFGSDQGMCERTWWTDMIRLTLTHAGCPEALEDDVFPLVFQRIYSSFGSTDAWAACPEGQLAMRHAKERGLVVGCVSNVYPRYVDQNLPLLGLHRDLDFAVTSHEEKVAKPNSAIFRAAARRASTVSRLLYGDSTAEIVPAEMLHVGDSLSNDYLAAKAIGMKALLLDPEGTAAHEELEAADVVKSLEELPAKIDELLGV